MQQPTKMLAPDTASVVSNCPVYLNSSSASHHIPSDQVPLYEWTMSSEKTQPIPINNLVKGIGAYPKPDQVVLSASNSSSRPNNSILEDATASEKALTAGKNSYFFSSKKQERLMPLPNATSEVQDVIMWLQNVSSENSSRALSDFIQSCCCSKNAALDNSTFVNNKNDTPDTEFFSPKKTPAEIELCCNELSNSDEAQQSFSCLSRPTSSALLSESLECKTPKTIQEASSLSTQPSTSSPVVLKSPVPETNSFYQTAKHLTGIPFLVPNEANSLKSSSFEKLELQSHALGPSEFNALADCGNFSTNKTTTETKNASDCSDITFESTNFQNRLSLSSRDSKTSNRNTTVNTEFTAENKVVFDSTTIPIHLLLSSANLAEKKLRVEDNEYAVDRDELACLQATNENSNEIQPPVHHDLLDNKFFVINNKNMKMFHTKDNAIKVNGSSLALKPSAEKLPMFHDSSSSGTPFNYTFVSSSSSPLSSNSSSLFHPVCYQKEEKEPFYKKFSREHEENSSITRDSSSFFLEQQEQDSIALSEPYVSTRNSVSQPQETDLNVGPSACRESCLDLNLEQLASALLANDSFNQLAAASSSRQQHSSLRNSNLSSCQDRFGCAKEDKSSGHLINSNSSKIQASPDYFSNDELNPNAQQLLLSALEHIKLLNEKSNNNKFRATQKQLHNQDNLLSGSSTSASQTQMLATKHNSLLNKTENDSNNILNNNGESKLLNTNSLVNSSRLFSSENTEQLLLLLLSIEENENQFVHFNNPGQTTDYGGVVSSNQNPYCHWLENLLNKHVESSYPQIPAVNGQLTTVNDDSKLVSLIEHLLLKLLLHRQEQKQHRLGYHADSGTPKQTSSFSMLQSLLMMLNSNWYPQQSNEQSSSSVTTTQTAPDSSYIHSATAIKGVHAKQNQGGNSTDILSSAEGNNALNKRKVTSNFEENNTGSRPIKKPSLPMNKKAVSNATKKDSRYLFLKAENNNRSNQAGSTQEMLQSQLLQLLSLNPDAIENLTPRDHQLLSRMFLSINDRTEPRLPNDNLLTLQQRAASSSTSSSSYTQNQTSLMQMLSDVFTKQVFSPTSSSATSPTTSQQQTGNFLSQSGLALATTLAEITQQATTAQPATQIQRSTLDVAELTRSLKDDGQYSFDAQLRTHRSAFSATDENGTSSSSGTKSGGISSKKSATEYLCTYPGVSWNTRMQSWLVYYEDAKGRKSRTFNPKRLTHSQLEVLPLHIREKYAVEPVEVAMHCACVYAARVRWEGRLRKSLGFQGSRNHSQQYRSKLLKTNNPSKMLKGSACSNDLQSSQGEGTTHTTSESSALQSMDTQLSSRINLSDHSISANKQVNDSKERIINDSSDVGSESELALPLQEETTEISNKATQPDSPQAAPVILLTNLALNHMKNDTMNFEDSLNCSTSLSKALTSNLSKSTQNELKSLLNQSNVLNSTNKNCPKPITNVQRFYQASPKSYKSSSQMTRNSSECDSPLYHNANLSKPYNDNEKHSNENCAENDCCFHPEKNGTYLKHKLTTRPNSASQCNSNFSNNYDFQKPESTAVTSAVKPTRQNSTNSDSTANFENELFSTTNQAKLQLDGAMLHDTDNNENNHSKPNHINSRMRFTTINETIPLEKCAESAIQQNNGTNENNTLPKRRRFSRRLNEKNLDETNYYASSFDLNSTSTIYGSQESDKINTISSAKVPQMSKRSNRRRQSTNSRYY